MDNDMDDSFTGYGIGPLGYKLKNPFRNFPGMDFFNIEPFKSRLSSNYIILAIFRLVLEKEQTISGT